MSGDLTGLCLYMTTSTNTTQLSCYPVTIHSGSNKWAGLSHSTRKAVPQIAKLKGEARDGGKDGQINKTKKSFAVPSFLYNLFHSVIDQIISRKIHFAIP